MHSVKFKNLSRLLGKARIWWGYGFSEARKKHKFWWRKSTGYKNDSVLSKRWAPWWDSQSAWGQEVLPVLLPLKKMGSGRPVNVIGEVVSPSRTQQVLNVIWKHRSGWCRGDSRALAHVKTSVSPANQPSNHRHISRPQEPFLKPPFKTTPTAGSGITGSSFLQELMYSHCFAWCWGKQAS